MADENEREDGTNVAVAEPAGGEFQAESEPDVSEGTQATPSAEPQVPPVAAVGGIKPTPQEPETPRPDVNLEELRILRQRTEEQRRQIQAVESARARDQSERAIEERVEAHRREEREWLTRQNIDPAEAEQRVERSAATRREQLQNEVRQREVAMHLVQARHESAQTVMESWLAQLTRDNGLDSADQETLRALMPTDLLTQETLLNPNANLGTDSRFREIAVGVARAAKRLGTAAKVTREATASRQAAVKPQQLEGRAGGGVMSDEEVINAFGDPDSGFDDVKRAEEAMRRLGYRP